MPKYGRLFTQEEVDELVGQAAGLGASEVMRLAHESGVEIVMPTEDLTAGVNRIRAEHRGRFASDEPLFVLRAQDLFATAAVRAYRDRLQEEGDNEGALAVDEALKEMRSWQRENPDRVRLPD